MSANSCSPQTIGFNKISVEKYHATNFNHLLSVLDRYEALGYSKWSENTKNLARDHFNKSSETFRNSVDSKTKEKIFGKSTVDCPSASNSSVISEQNLSRNIAPIVSSAGGGQALPLHTPASSAESLSVAIDSNIGFPLSASSRSTENHAVPSDQLGSAIAGLAAAVDARMAQSIPVTARAVGEQFVPACPPGSATAQLNAAIDACMARSVPVTARAAVEPPTPQGGEEVNDTGLAAAVAAEMNKTNFR